MKKFLMSLCFLISFSSVVMAGVSVELNGEKINFTDENGLTVNPQIINNRTMVPLRKIFETLGAQIEWYGETETVVATKGDTVVKLQINNPIAEVTKSGVIEKITLDSKPIIVENRTLVPLRFISESLEKQVAWDQNSQTAIIIDYEYFINEIKNRAPIFGKAIEKENTQTSLKIVKEYYDLSDSSKNTNSVVNAQIYNNSKTNKKVVVNLSGTSELFKEIANEGWSNFDIVLDFSEKGVTYSSSSSIINKMLEEKYRTYESLNLKGSFDDSWEIFIKNIYGFEEKDIGLATFYRLDSEYKDFLKLFDFSNTATSSTIKGLGVNYSNATTKYLDYTKFDNVLLENDIVQVYNILNKLIFNYDVEMDAILYDASNINFTIKTTNTEGVFNTSFVVELLNEFDEKVVYTVNITK
ncbi:MAG: copper amine oxidase N-terminal domain-containing protein [Clostridia bacterium]|nr:copper amine oxidase N-terminal domain-containing protein [Clostridia bacterium]